MRRPYMRNLFPLFIHFSDHLKRYNCTACGRILSERSLLRRKITITGTHAGHSSFIIFFYRKFFDPFELDFFGIKYNNNDCILRE